MNRERETRRERYFAQSEKIRIKTLLEEERPIKGLSSFCVVLFFFSILGCFSFVLCFVILVVLSEKREEENSGEMER